MAGDLTYANSPGRGQAAVDQHFNDVMRWSTRAAYMPAWGNHEYECPALDDLRNYKGRFLLPNAQASPGSPDISCCGNDWGWCDAGPVRFISYPEPWSGAWADWRTKAGPLMQQAQNDPAIQYIVTFGHRSAYSTGSHLGSETNLSLYLDALGDSYSKYVLNIAGHSHNYERYQPIHGVTHVTVGAGASLVVPWKGSDPRTAFRALRLSHLRVDVGVTGMRLQAVCDQPTSSDDVVCANGAVMDELLIAPPAPPSGPGIINVPSQQPTLQAAVAVAKTGDTILLAPGTYQGGVLVQGKALTIASWYQTTSNPSYIDQTVITGYAPGYCGGAGGCAGNAVIEFGSQAHGSAVRGLTITEGVDGVRSSSRVDIAHSRMLRNGDGADYGNESGGVFSDNVFADSTDDGIDLNGRLSVKIVRNIVRDNGDDGIEFRMYPYSGPTLNVEISDNQFIHNDSDGIQLIDSPDASSRVVRIERNLFHNNRKASIGCMGNQETSEDYSGTPLDERVYVTNNTFTGEYYGLVGGANSIVLNNVFDRVQMSAVRRVTGASIAAHNLYWANGTSFEDSNVDQSSSVFASPQLAPDFRLQPGSPAIDAGTASYQWRGETVLFMPPGSYVGPAPDLGAFEYDASTPTPNVRPTVDAGPDQTITLPSSATLNGTATDDGKPTNTLTTTWSQLSGPGTTTFTNSAATSTTASFSAPGTYQLQLSASDGQLTSNDTVQITVQPTPAPGAGSLDRRIATGTDDAEESATGTLSTGSSDLELVYDGSNQHVGLRFTNLTIPAGATIANAYLQFEADETQDEPTTLTLHGQAADNPATFSSSNKVSTRPRTTTSTTWSPLPWTLVGETGPRQRTPDLSAVIQQILNRPGWTSGNALTLIISGTGHRTATAYNATPTGIGAPLLHIDYNTGGGTPPNRSTHRRRRTRPDDHAAQQRDPERHRHRRRPAHQHPDHHLEPAQRTRHHHLHQQRRHQHHRQLQRPGTYQLQLSASDGQLTSNDTVQITVQPAPATNQAPTVDAGPDQTITLPSSATLNGTATDDGQPTNTLTTTWSQLSGPGTTTFTNSAATSTTASFSAPGTYQLQLSASDGQLTSNDTVQITVQPTPAPGAGSLDRRIATGTDDAEESATGTLSTAAATSSSSTTAATSRSACASPTSPSPPAPPSPTPTSSSKPTRPKTNPPP